MNKQEIKKIRNTIKYSVDSSPIMAAFAMNPYLSEEYKLTFLYDFAIDYLKHNETYSNEYVTKNTEIKIDYSLTEDEKIAEGFKTIDKRTSLRENVNAGLIVKITKNLYVVSNNKNALSLSTKQLNHIKLMESIPTDNKNEVKESIHSYLKQQLIEATALSKVELLDKINESELFIKKTKTNSRVITAKINKKEINNEFVKICPDTYISSTSLDNYIFENFNNLFEKYVGDNILLYGDCNFGNELTKFDKQFIDKFEGIKSDYKLAKELVSVNPECLEYLDENLKDNLQVVLAAVKNSDWYINKSSERIQELCQNSDPVATIEKIILKESLEKEVNLNQTKQIKRKI